MTGGPFADAALQYACALGTLALDAVCGIPQSCGSFPQQAAGTFQDGHSRGRHSLGSLLPHLISVLLGP